jgi:hypothetical protein
MRRWTAALTGLTALLLPTLNAAVMACPMCKDSIPNAEGPAGPGGPSDPSQMSSASLPGGFNTSVYLMLIGLFVCMGLVAWTVIKGIRNTPNRAPGFPVVHPATARAQGQSA